MEKKLMSNEQLKKEIKIIREKNESLREMNRIINSIEIDGQHFSAVLTIHSALVRVN